MCGIAGIVGLRNQGTAPVTRQELHAVSYYQSHRGPDDFDIWQSDDRRAGFAHHRLEIIDLSPTGHQPMSAENGTTIVYNGEVYNYLELGEMLAGHWSFKGHSDTEAILAAYDRWGTGCVEHLQGMFAFAIWDEKNNQFFAARDRFGIKPFYYAVIDNRLVFASEIKSLLPFFEQLDTDEQGLNQYMAFQFTIGEMTMFKGIKALAPGHMLSIKDGVLSIEKYWDVYFNADMDHTPQYFENRLKELVDESIGFHLRSDVPVGSYLSGGIDSSLIAVLASRHDDRNKTAFHGKFTGYDNKYDESRYAQEVAQGIGKELHQIDITADDFINNVEKVIYHLDQPTAGPGSFPQYMVSGLARSHVKVVLGGQGGDELFGGYARYLVAYLEQCLKAAIEGTYRDGHFVVTIEDIVPNLGVLREYKPMLASFWKDGLFENLDARYFRLVDRFADMNNEIVPEVINRETTLETFRAIFNDETHVHNKAYFDRMTFFDFKTLLPALLHVEDRMSMAHGLESRVPLIDTKLIEFLATVPAMVTFNGGNLKVMLKNAYADILPSSVLNRRDKMGFPVPLNEWYQSHLHDYVMDQFTSSRFKNRGIFQPDAVVRAVENASQFSRKQWGLLSLELWFQQFHDKHHEMRKILKEPAHAQQTPS